MHVRLDHQRSAVKRRQYFPSWGTVTGNESASQPHTWDRSGLWRYGCCPAPRLPALLSEFDEKSFGTPDVAEPIRVFALDHFADELRAALAEAGERVVDVLHGEHDPQVPELTIQDMEQLILRVVKCSGGESSNGAWTSMAESPSAPEVWATRMHTGESRNHR